MTTANVMNFSSIFFVSNFIQLMLATFMMPFINTPSLSIKLCQTTEISEMAHK